MVTMTEVWRQQFQDLQAQALAYAEDCECKEMLERLPETEDSLAYLGFLVPRLKTMQHQMNWVEYDVKLRAWIIHNYSFQMYQYCQHKYPGAIFSPHRIVLADEEITLEDRDKLLARR